MIKSTYIHEKILDGFRNALIIIYYAIIPVRYYLTSHLNLVGINAC